MKSWANYNILLTICNLIEKSYKKNNLFTQKTLRKLIPNAVIHGMMFFSLIIILYMLKVHDVPYLCSYINLFLIKVNYNFQFHTPAFSCEIKICSDRWNSQKRKINSVVFTS